VGNRYSEATTIALIEFDIEDFQAVFFKHPVDLLEGVIFQVFMTDRIERIDSQHGRHVALFHDPDSIRVEYAFDIRDKT